MTQHMLDDVAFAGRNIQVFERQPEGLLSGMKPTGEVAIIIVTIIAAPVTFQLDIGPNLKQLLNEAVFWGWISRRLGWHERPVRIVCIWPSPLFITCGHGPSFLLLADLSNPRFHVDVSEGIILTDAASMAHVEFDPFLKLVICMGRQRGPIYADHYQCHGLYFP
ncbi:hypothetical protein ACV1C4_23345 [Aeromonas hydrophila]|uniref:hypothetical protein n=1 Tax=Aeromonas hydrophila TaxID=644 RepID=UPI003EC5E044